MPPLLHSPTKAQERRFEAPSALGFVGGVTLALALGVVLEAARGHAWSAAAAGVLLGVSASFYFVLLNANDKYVSIIQRIGK